mmetsp:Transcript_51147/g.104051  ORF Transcript_51147/g.104051 Transcript_51147/m.104051 type:complete len:98 (-) Transcript_51147:703-996(-)
MHGHGSLEAERFVCHQPTSYTYTVLTISPTESPVSKTSFPSTDPSALAVLGSSAEASDAADDATAQGGGRDTSTNCNRWLSLLCGRACSSLSASSPP